MPVRLRSFVPVVVVASFGPPAAVAATLEVGPGKPWATIGEALAAAANGDVIEVQPGTWQESLVVQVDVTLIGVGGAGSTVLDPPLPLLVQGATATIAGFTLEAGGVRALEVSDATVTLDASVLTGAIHMLDGGAVLVERGALHAIDTTFDDDLTYGSGGHIAARESTVTLERCTLSAASGFDGGCLHATDSDVIVIDSVFDGCAAYDDGGALYVERGSLELVGGTLSGNTTPDDGGALALVDCDANLVGTTFLGNFAYGDGGALVSDSALTLEGCTFEDNSADDGGAVAVRSPGALVVRDSTFVGNEATADAGGAIDWLHEAGASLVVEGSAFVANVASGPGGAIAARSGDGLAHGSVVVTSSWFESGTAARGGAVSLDLVDSADVAGSTFCANVGSFTGGAVRVRLGGGQQQAWRNNVFSRNTAVFTGGAVYFEASGPATVVNNTFVANGAIDGGAVRAQGTVDFLNNVVAFTPDGSGLSATTTSGRRDYNLWFENTPGDAAGSITSADLGHMVVADPLFVLWDPLGGCDDDLGPAAGSPLIDGGDPVLLDSDCTASDLGATGGVPPGDDVPDCDGDGHLPPVDCRDGDAAAHPDAVEVCDGIDNDCDGGTDDGEATDAGSWYEDVDADGWGGPAAIVACEPAEGYVAQPGDCDDAVAEVYPGALEVCDEVDNDCDGSVDVGVTTAFWPDSDGDGYGDGAPVEDCGPLEGYAPAAGDCADGDPLVYPGAPEWCNGQDDDCDGSIDENVGGTDCDGELPPGPETAAGCGCVSVGAASSPWALFVSALWSGWRIRKRRERVPPERA